MVNNDPTPRAMISLCLECSLVDTCGVDQFGLLLPVQDIENRPSCPLLMNPRLPPEFETKKFVLQEDEVETINLENSNAGSNTLFNILGPAQFKASLERTFRVSVVDGGDSALNESDSGSEESSQNTVQLKPAAMKDVHRLTEKRYRSNLNDKIKALQDILPSYRPFQHEVKYGKDKFAAGESIQIDRRMSSGPRFLKRNKGTVLIEAVAYIRQLEKRIKGLEQQMLLYPDSKSGIYDSKES